MWNQSETFTGCRVSQTRGGGVSVVNVSTAPCWISCLWKLPTSSEALEVNQRHKGYDVRLVTNDNMMCTETTWQFAAINLGAGQVSFFSSGQVRHNTGQDEIHFCQHTVWCEFWPAVHRKGYSPFRELDRTLKHVLKIPYVCKVYMRHLTRQVTFRQVVFGSQRHNPISPPNMCWAWMTCS